MQIRAIRARFITHGLTLLLLVGIPFLLGWYRNTATLMVLLLLVWPVASIFSPLRIALRGAPWYLAFLVIPVFLMLPVFVLLTPSAMRYLGVYLMLDLLLAVGGALFGGWRNKVRGWRAPASGYNL